ncbi:MAG: bifunctional 23S rRNA (guanine(2069)-N(7))-methyltransferase RlmK/23S rRNA (guanine(2445)-N(2))-methyltransferase RlmL [Nannocystaceae bacterium]|nr:bifunctional 23S rRNA (guanine(2069)-N(7))-methyltransferase RlmK/23S rRNA (guanine(2445)-N(2))-methyltransferase RlmL [Nannocystaceae bacterium]
MDYVGQRAAVSHAQFAAQRTKDAIVDRLRERSGGRPTVDLEAPDVRINVFARGAGCSVSIDLAGDSLHRRGWRKHAGLAPLRETTAASMLVDAGWTAMAKDGAAFVDPMAGSGTFVFEALAIAADIAPGVLRQRFGFHGWLGHEPELFTTIRDDARRRADEGLAGLSNRFVAADAEANVIAIARDNASAIGWEDKIDFEVCRVDEWTTAPAARGLLVTNPPYGQRMGGPAGARKTAGELGRTLGTVFPGWRACVLLGDERLVHVLGTTPESTRPIDNGTIEALSVTMEIGGLSDQAELVQSFANRLKKNKKKLRAWLKRDAVSCYRLYDGDIPEANVAVDCYGDWVHVQEYEAPPTVDAEVARARFEAIVRALPAALGVPAERVVVKQRRRQRGSSQYEKQGDAGARILVEEGGHRFWVNLEDYLDTGLFLDHRPVRALVAQLVAERTTPSFLNLFSYTSTATVYAIAAGANRTTSVDLSNTYLAWSRDNFSLADVTGTGHRLVKEDVRRLLSQDRREYDVILLDPPTFSTSKAMQGTLDILRDHAALIDAAMRRLAPGGELIFSTNSRC